MRRIAPVLFLLSLAAALVAACERPREEERARALTAHVLRDMMVYPASTLVSFAAGEEAGQVVLSTPAAVDTVTAWYRQVLRLNGWELRQDQQRPDGSRILYAVKTERPLWITLRRTAGAPGTTYTLIAAEVAADSAAAADTAQRSGSSMSSKRIQRR
ncbi:MAG: hypothetical protein ACRDHF_04530 [Tepidiformaceae bacterium]